MIKWLKKFKYETIAVQQLCFTFVDSDVKDHFSLIFKVNGFGKRRIDVEGRARASHKDHYYWHKYAVPWREGIPVDKEEKKDNVVQLKVVD